MPKSDLNSIGLDNTRLPWRQQRYMRSSAVAGLCQLWLPCIYSSSCPGFLDALQPMLNLGRIHKLQTWLLNDCASSTRMPIRQAACTIRSKNLSLLQFLSALSAALYDTLGLLTRYIPTPAPIHTSACNARNAISGGRYAATKDLSPPRSVPVSGNCTLHSCASLTGRNR